MLRKMQDHTIFVDRTEKRYYYMSMNTKRHGFLGLVLSRYGLALESVRSATVRAFAVVPALCSTLGSCNQNNGGFLR